MKLLKKLTPLFLIASLAFAFGCSTETSSTYTDYNNEFFGIYFEIPGEFQIELQDVQPYMGKYLLNLRMVDSDFSLDEKGFQATGSSVYLLVNSLNFSDARYPADYVVALAEKADGTISMGSTDEEAQNNQMISYYGELTASNDNYYQFTVLAEDAKTAEKIFTRVIQSARISASDTTVVE